ncbi:MAG: hypothetical protein H6Q67_1405 [Firmicutes bacterium]|nr:hypothetical protein [Bacillota bacterium]
MYKFLSNLCYALVLVMLMLGLLLSIGLDIQPLIHFFPRPMGK